MPGVPHITSGKPHPAEDSSACFASTARPAGGDDCDVNDSTTTAILAEHADR